jgi:hypothetical protein
VIDFRYHLVSIVSIFLALAVGIVLGAGPLQRQLGETLSQQVAQLRQDKTDLRGQLDTAQQRNDAAEVFAGAVTADVVRSRLVGRSVVVVLLPGAETSLADDVGKTVLAAGARVTGRVRVQPSWVDPDPGKVGVRARLIDELASLTPGIAADASPDQRLSALLARALVAPSAAEATRRSAPAARALGALKDAGLVSVSGDDPTPATLAVLVAGKPDPGAKDPTRAAALASWVSAADALDGAGAGAVVAGPTESTEPVGVLGALRGTGAVAGRVSTVDDMGLSMGRVAVVLALRQQVVGDAGQYGTGVGADQVLPPSVAEGS